MLRWAPVCLAVAILTGMLNSAGSGAFTLIMARILFFLAVGAFVFLFASTLPVGKKHAKS